MIESVLEKLTKELTQAHYTKENENLFLFEVGENLLLFIQEVEDLIYLSGNICPCPEENLEELFIYLMRANLLGEGTGKASIGLDSEENNIILSKAFAFDPDEQHMKEEIELFANYLLFWKEEIKKIESQREANMLK